MVGNEVMPLGTAFSLKGNLFATAAHVVGVSDANLVLCIDSISSLGQYQLDDARPIGTLEATIVQFDAITDVAIIKCDRLNYISSTKIGDAEDLRVGDRVGSFGYPHADYSRVVLTYQENFVGAKVLLPSHGLRIKHIVLNTIARPGQSGAPVFDRGGCVRAMIVGGFSPNPGGGGVNFAGVDPLTLHQTTHAVSSEYIEELL